MQNKPSDEIDSKYEHLIVIGLMLIALVTRIYGIWEWNIYGDEYTTITYAAERSKNLYNSAYYILVLGSYKLFGVNVWSARLPAVLFGVLSIPIFYMTWRNVIGRNAALIGALFITFHGWHLMYSQFSRFYTAVFLFGSLSYYLYYKSLRSDSYWYLFFAILSDITGYFFHTTFLMVPVSCGLFSAVIIIRKHPTDEGYSKRIAIAHFLFYTLCGLVLVPSLWRLAIFWISYKNPALNEPLTLPLHVTRYVEITILVSALFGIVFLFYREHLKGIFFLFGIGIPLLVLEIGSILLPSVQPRYIFYSLPLMICSSALLCDNLRLNLLSIKNPIFLNAAALIILAAQLPGFFSQ
jgi:4-amino-4-deoxy-L-arabinose transferase-like glycosyltransferase